MYIETIFENWEKSKQFMDKDIVNDYTEVSDELIEVDKEIRELERRIRDLTIRSTSLSKKSKTLKNNAKSSLNITFKVGQILNIEDFESFSDYKTVYLNGFYGYAGGAESNIEIIKVNPKSVTLKYKISYGFRMREVIRRVPIERMKRIYYSFITHQDYADSITNDIYTKINQ